MDIIVMPIDAHPTRHRVEFMHEIFIKEVEYTMETNRSLKVICIPISKMSSVVMATQISAVAFQSTECSRK